MEQLDNSYLKFITKFRKIKLYFSKFHFMQLFSADTTIFFRFSDLPTALQSEGLKIRGCQHYLFGIICPLGWDRFNWSFKIWRCHGTPGTPRDDRPVTEWHFWSSYKIPLCTAILRILAWCITTQHWRANHATYSFYKVSAIVSAYSINMKWDFLSKLYMANHVYFHT